MNIDRWELNAHLQKLTERWDTDAARAIVAAFNELRPTRSNKIKIKRTTTQGNVTTGHTGEAGDVSIADRDRMVVRVEGERPEEYERIGKFKIKRQEYPQNNCAIISFQHFWASNIYTLGTEAPPEIYGLEYDLESEEPYALMVLNWKEGELPSIIKIRDYFNRLIFWFSLGIVNVSTFYKVWLSACRTIHGRSRLAKD
jgi:hypothetical protein